MWELDDEVGEFELSFDDVPCAATAAVLESADSPSLSDDQLIDAMAGWGRVASWAQAKQSAVIAEFAKRRPPEWMDDTDVDRFAVVEIAVRCR